MEKNMQNEMEQKKLEEARKATEAQIQAQLEKYASGELELAELTEYVKSKLPRYMIPNVTRQLDNLPLIPNGKIDRNLLKRMYEQK